MDFSAARVYIDFGLRKARGRCEKVFFIMRQFIVPERRIFTTGEVVTFTLDPETPALPPGRAVLRTNLGSAAVRRGELLKKSRTGNAVAGLDWHDVTMKRQKNGRFVLHLPLVETGCFEAKCCYIPDDGSPILWPGGENFHIKCVAASCAAGNAIYCAFVRQHGKGCEKAHSEPDAAGLEELDKKNYTAIPPSGTFRDLIGHLDHIFGELGCNILQLLPIHPTPTQYGRMGRYGSPFAATDYFSVDPALAEFDPKATPMEQFGELVDAVHRRAGRIFLDLPVNHTGWASKLQLEHPGYFRRRADGTFESPGAWGIVWEDLCQLDYSVPELRELMAKVFLFWCRRGVDGFRCDAGYMLPVLAWEHIVSQVRDEFPDTVFLLEGLGGSPQVQEGLLRDTDLDWAYSELFQCYTRDEIERYYPYACEVGDRCGTLANFAETHDNTRLAAKGTLYAANRFAVSALLSAGGAFGFANGAEFFATERIDVHGNGALNYGASPNLNGEIAKYNRLLADHTAFDLAAKVELIQRGGGNVVAARRTGDDGSVLLVLINLNCSAAETVHWDKNATPKRGFDLLAEEPCEFASNGALLEFKLAPGEARCATFDDYRIPETMPAEPPRRELRRLAKQALQVAVAYLPPERAASIETAAMASDPKGFIAAVSGLNPPPVTRWNYPADARREVMIPPRDTLLIESPTPFRFAVTEGKKRLATVASLPGGKAGFFACVPPFPAEMHDGRRLRVEVTGFTPGNDRAEHLSGTLLLLPEAGAADFSRVPENTDELAAFGSNSTGGYMYTPATWGALHTKYNALLAANLNPDHPVDRTVIFTRCRAWLIVNDFSQELTSAVITDFASHPDNSARWTFQLPTGQGGRATIRVDLAFARDADAVRMTVSRPVKEDRPGELDASTAAKIILRPDLEWRVNHQLTKAYTGPEKRFPAAIRTTGGGFTFAPYGGAAHFNVSRGAFRRQDEWRYMEDLPFERRYGLGDKTDLYSPGYFEFTLRGGESSALTASLTGAPDEKAFPKFSDAVLRRPEEFIDASLRHYVVKRDGRRTVIAGYPWFLDWGRDTLIALRGLVRCGFHKECVEIIRQFASFEDRGTIPNMICGSDTGNRDTSDAPLYLVTAVKECIDATGDKSLLDLKCGERKLSQVLDSIVDNYLAGTPNGIAADPDSMLVYSPAHFSWMDTAHPAGTPRAGYPVEIQALWYAALSFLGRDGKAEQVRKSIARFYFPENLGFCSDCLHAERRVPAAEAVPDDHLRPNQLFAVTLGAVTTHCLRDAVIDACGELLVPGAIRTLADREVKFHLPIEFDGRLLNDPARPYRGRYEGPEDTSRKVAYHNGTAWCWPFPAYCEALYMAGGEAVRRRALSLLESMSARFNAGVPFQPPEVVDGDAPHAPGGCPAQAWSVSEFFRVYKLLTDDAR